jgi:hypothetical protein
MTIAKFYVNWGFAGIAPQNPPVWMCGAASPRHTSTQLTAARHLHHASDLHLSEQPEHRISVVPPTSEERQLYDI